MMTFKTITRKALYCATLALVITGTFSTAYAASKAVSHIGITKLASLQVTPLDSAELYSDSKTNDMHTSTCLRTGGEPVPYSVRANSLNGKSNFKVASDTGSDEIIYNVAWSQPDGKQYLSNSGELTDVQTSQAQNNCDYHTLSVEMDDRGFASASEATYTDALQVIFVIE